MAVPAPAKAACALAASVVALVLLWCVHFRGGLALGSPANKGLIFNAHPVLMLIGFIILGSEVGIWLCHLLPWRFTNTPAWHSPIARSGVALSHSTLAPGSSSTCWHCSRQSWGSCSLEKLTFLQAAGVGRYSSVALLVNFTALIVILLGTCYVCHCSNDNEHTHGYSAVHKS